MRTFLDACVLIYAVEGTGAVQSAAIDLLLDTRRDWVITELVRFEILVGIEKASRIDLREAYEALLSHLAVHVQPVSAALVERAAELRASRGLKSLDALHLAGALLSDCQRLATNDRRLAAASGLIELEVIGQ